jgi:hypothetical protein
MYPVFFIILVEKFVSQTISEKVYSLKSNISVYKIKIRIIIVIGKKCLFFFLHKWVFLTAVIP